MTSPIPVPRGAENVESRFLVESEGDPRAQLVIGEVAQESLIVALYPGALAAAQVEAIQVCRRGVAIVDRDQRLVGVIRGTTER